MKKFFGVAIAVVLLASVTFAAPAPKLPKATGDADWINTPEKYNQQANTTFNAINTKAGDFKAKGSLIYTDANVTYTMDVQYLKVEDETAWFAGQVTSLTVTGINPGVDLGDWVLYKVVDKGEPGIGADQIWGENLTKGEHIDDSSMVLPRLLTGPDPLGGPFFLNGGNIQVH
jgi:hypothetical protein